VIQTVALVAVVALLLFMPGLGRGSRSTRALAAWSRFTLAAGLAARIPGSLSSPPGWAATADRLGAALLVVALAMILAALPGFTRERNPPTR
jgi:hypothetical protein